MNYDMKFGERITEEWQRAKLQELLEATTPEQQRIFALMYPKGVPAAGLSWAMTQCNNSIIKNLGEKETNETTT